MADTPKKNVPQRPSAPKKDKLPIGQRISKWFRELRAELKKVTWPSKKEVIRNTLVTMALVVFLGAIVIVCDVIFNFVRNALITREESAPPAVSDTVTPDVTPADLITGDTVSDTVSDNVSDVVSPSA